MRLFKKRRKKRQDQYQEYVNYQETNPEEEASNLLEPTAEEALHSEADPSFERYEQEYRREVGSEVNWDNDPYGTAYLHQENEGDEMRDPILEDSISDEQEDSDPSPQRRAKYSAKIDHFLNNGIIIVGALLVMVLLIAFLA